jgi:hypothetical protein
MLTVSAVSIFFGLKFRYPALFLIVFLFAFERLKCEIDTL